MTNSFALQRSRCARALKALSIGSEWSAKDVNWYVRQIDRYFYNLHCLERRMSKPNARRNRPLRMRLLSSYSGRLCGFLQEESARGITHIKPQSPQQLEQFLRSVRPTKRIFECARTTTHTKPNGQTRTTLSPGPKIRSAQRLVGDVLKASGIANPFDFNCAGKGREAAIAEIIRLIEDQSIRDFVVFDLENYFTSLDAKHLTGVPLPDQVIQHSVLFARKATLLHTKGNAAEAEAARHGLPQGARVSGILASSLLGRELCHLDGAMGIVTYVDDVVIGACDPAGAKSLAQAIKLRFGNLPGGPLSFKRFDVVHIEQGLDFLGYFLRLKSAEANSHVIVKPSHRAKLKLERNVIRKLSALPSKPSWDDAVKLALEYAARWRDAFPAWKPTTDEIYEFEGIVETFVDDFFSMN